MKIVKTIDKGKCNWCQKEKELVQVEMNGQNISLCWPDLKRTVKLRVLTEPEKKV